ncbi:M23 family metallopeptidase [Zhihengliuella sp.]|uniref:M23 family metallopeptidase n=1 Tax=Zhihengliuella sp. TaxID=1954483 RepID=UPI0028120788|nr:M23 family metallopeptidase [Zhihengliuella sp.]
MNEPVEDAPAASEQPLRRPRGSERRRLLQQETACAAPAEADYIGRRYARDLRYSAATTDELAALLAGREAAAGDVVDLAAHRIDRPVAAPARRGVALSHKFAAAAAVSGIALTAAWPQISSEAQDAGIEVAGSPAGAAEVEDVVVAADAPYELEMASIQASFTEDDRLDQIMAASGGDVTRVETGGVLAQPLDQVRITSRFGLRADPWGGGGTVNHIGQDYGAACGTPVKAAASGTVVQAGYAGHSGNRVRIDHGNGLETTYNHNSSLKVAVGQKVDRGDVVSLSGTTGNSTGCHLHFEVLVDGTAVDPAGWL